MTLTTPTKRALEVGLASTAAANEIETAIDTAAAVTASEIALADGKVLIGNASGVSAAHTLTGDVTVSNAGVTAIGADKVTAAMLNEQVLKSVDVTLSSAQVLALNATPVQLVAAPGANKAIIFEGAVLHKPAGTAYAAIAAGDDLAIKYTDASGEDVGVCEMTNFADQATAQVRYIRPQTGALAAGTVSDIVPVANAALVAHMLTGEITTGDSAFRFRVYYRVVPTTLA